MIVARYKVCTSCLVELPATPDNFHRQRGGKFGFTSKCKACKNAQIKDWAVRNPDKSRAQKMRWKSLNYEKYLQIKKNDQRRRKYALKNGKVAVEEWHALLKSYGYACAYCGSKNDITQDHIMPLSKGGSNEINNIQPLCRTCNSTKRDKMPVASDTID